MSETPAFDAVRAKLGLLLSVRSRTVTNRIAQAVHDAPLRLAAAVLLIGLIWVGLYGLFRLLFVQLSRTPLEATVANARQFLDVAAAFGSFDRYIWQFVGGETIQHRCRTLGQIPATTKESDAMSKELRARGFRFVGSTICYAFMQAAGMVNDHVVDCFRYGEVSNAGRGRDPRRR